MKRDALEFRIGLFVTAGLVLLLVMIIAFGEMSLFRREYQVIGVFNGSVGNVTRGAPVRLAGVDIGKAADIKLDKNGTVRAHLRIYDEFTLRKDSELLIKQDGILGEYYFEFSSGSDTAEPLPKTGAVTVNGRMQTSIGDIAPAVSRLLTEYEPKLGELLDSLNKTVAGINVVVADPRTQEYFKKSVANVSDTIAKGPALADKLSEAVVEANATIKTAKAFIDRLNTSVDAVNGVLASAKEQMTGLGKHYSALATDLRGLSAKMETILNSMQRLIGESKTDSTVGRLFTEDQLYQKLVETLDQARTTLAQVKSTFRYLEENPTALYWGDKSRHKVTTEDKNWLQRIFRINAGGDKGEGEEAAPEGQPKPEAPRPAAAPAPKPDAPKDK